MNIDKVRTKLEVLDGNRAQLRRLAAMSDQEFSRDVMHLDSALHRIQTSVQALLDIGAYVVGALELPSPGTSADIIRALAGAGFVPAEHVPRYNQMIAFRNRVVHLYNRIDPSLVHDIVREHAADLDELRDLLIAVIAAHPDPGITMLRPGGQ